MAILPALTADGPPDLFGDLVCLLPQIGWQVLPPRGLSEPRIQSGECRRVPMADMLLPPVVARLPPKFGAIANR